MSISIVVREPRIDLEAHNRYSRISGPEKFKSGDRKNEYFLKLRLSGLKICVWGCLGSVLQTMVITYPDPVHTPAKGRAMYVGSHGVNSAVFDVKNKRCYVFRRRALDDLLVLSLQCDVTSFSDIQKYSCSTCHYHYGQGEPNDHSSEKHFEFCNQHNT